MKLTEKNMYTESTRKIQNTVVPIYKHLLAFWKVVVIVLLLKNRIR